MTESATSRRRGSSRDKARARLPTPGTLEYWFVDLARTSDDDPGWLDAHERERAQRLLHARDRLRFVRAHTALRRIVADYLGIHPGAWQWARGRHGKPALPEDLRGTRLCLNLSHSADHAMVAVACGLEIGADVEAERTDLPDSALAAGIMSPGEYAHWQRQGADERAASFFDCWTRKEACLKAIGCGLALPARRVEVGVGGQAHTTLAANFEGTTWELGCRAVPAPAGVHAALAWHGACRSLIERTPRSVPVEVRRA